jgi:hypothetical protein
MAAGWVRAQWDFLDAVDAYARAELALPPDYQVDSHEAGGHYRLLFPHFQVCGDASILAGMEAVLAARRAWVHRSLFHGYVDCDEVHHQPETFLFFQMPLMFLTKEPGAVEAVVDFAHHVGNWVPEVPAWYDWESHGFRSTWLGTRAIRAFPPYDYQEANHLRFVAVAVAAFVATGEERYRELATDYASRWCGHIEELAAAGQPIACSILPAGALRKEMGDRVPDGKRRAEAEYPVFYQTVATNTACEIAGALLDIHRLTGDGRMLHAARALIAQFYEHADSTGRPPSQFSDGAWGNPGPRSPGDPLEEALAGQNFFLVRTTEKYRAVSGDSGFDAAIIRWADGIDEERRPQDRLHMALMTAAHRISGEPSFLERSCRMSLWGMAATEANRIWHQCGASTRYGFRSMIDAPYDALLAGVDYATRGGLPMIGLEHGSPELPGLPPTVALRCWEATPCSLSIEAINTGDTTVSWRFCSQGSGGHLRGLEMTVKLPGAAITPEGDGWRVSLPAGRRVRLDGTWVGRGPVSRRDLWHGE